MELVSSKVGSLFNLIIPHNINLDKMRMGRDKDGGYIVPKNILADALLSYGIGINAVYKQYQQTEHFDTTLLSC